MSRKSPRSRRRRIILSVLLVPALYLSYLGVTLVQTLTNPAYGVTAMARFAEWGRGHGLTSEVNWAEAVWYRLHPTKIGGLPPKGSFGPNTSTTTTPRTGHLSPPRPIAVVNPLPGEGLWHAVGRTDIHHQPAVYEAFVRPDTTHTSYVVGLAWMDTTILNAQLYSGSYIPGHGPFTHTAPISPVNSTSLVAAFNAGFRMPDAEGGYYTDGHVVPGLPLRNGVASIVIYKNGHITVGMWGRDATLTKQVASVRQNLALIVDAGHPVAGLSSTDNTRWGATLGGSAYVWRSGLGVTSAGALVYAGGPSLSIVDLANVLARAGCVRAMELDINPDWVQYSIFQGAPHQPVSGSNGKSLLPSMLGSPSRYFASWWARDFVTMSLHP